MGGEAVPMLSEALLQLAADRLEGMVAPVTLCVAGEGEGLAAMAALAQELGSLTELVEYRADCEPDTDGLGPSLRLLDGWGRETGVRYVGLPLGQEFPVLLNDLVVASRGATSVSPLGRMQARELAGELMIFFTPG